MRYDILLHHTQSHEHRPRFPPSLQNRSRRHTQKLPLTICTNHHVSKRTKQEGFSIKWRRQHCHVPLVTRKISIQIFVAHETEIIDQGKYR
jgi:hypothetical protein